MFHSAEDLLHNLVALTPKLARKQFRRHIFEAWNWRCAYCDRQLDENSATIDHILPKHKGGQSVWSNLACSCSICNKNKSTSKWDLWFEKQLFYCEKRAKRIDKWIKQTDPSIESLCAAHVRNP